MIRYFEGKRLFSLTTENSEYQIKIDDIGILEHIYYGPPAGMDMSSQLFFLDRGFSGNPYEYRNNHGRSIDVIPQEYTGANVGDQRLSCLSVKSRNGSRSCDLRYVSHNIRNGKYTLTDLPYVRGDNGSLSKDSDCDTLEILLIDSLIGLEVSLLYGVFEKKDVITRCAVFHNVGKERITLNKAASICMDFPYGKFDLVHFHGRHCMERMKERVPVTHNVLSVSSRRGISSHHHNPFVILCDRHTDEFKGDAYGFMLMYSGNHKTEIEMDYLDSTRLVMGIHNANFAWKLDADSSFTAPEVILSYSGLGFNGLSHNFHHIIRENVIDHRFYDYHRPVLINNWEATYFNFNEEKIFALADAASEIGIEMLVLDDGWFGKRDSDNSSLGDWYEYKEKIPGGLKKIADGINRRGMKFGLWFEPEMISEDSELYRNHPEWAISDPDRKPMISRNQMVIDMSNPEVEDYLFKQMEKILENANIEYIKWDFNRSVANFYSQCLATDHEGEVQHRFMLGSYRLMGRLLKRFPGLFIEGCAGGGGRFDAGMMFYCPQIWTSDDTDPIARLKIQEGSSYGYPVSVMGSHVSASPNHQTGRITSLKTRAVVAMSGTFGYELDITRLTEAEKEEMRSQIRDFRKYYFLIQHGEYYRLTDERNEDYYTSWEFVSEDGSEALLNIVITCVHANPEIPYVRLQGLKSEGEYLLEGTDRVFTGKGLMNGGFAFGDMFMNITQEKFDNYPARQYHFVIRRQYEAAF